MDGLMAMDPYKKRMLQGAAQGAVTGGSTGFMLGGAPGGVVGLLAGGGAGALMARPGEDEQRYRARMRQLELGVLGPEEAAIRRQFMDPIRGAAQQQEIARRSLEQGTVTSGAAARRAQAAQAGARRDIGEAAAEAEMAILDLGERRRMMADQMRDQLRREEETRDRAFRASMADALPAAAADVGGVIAEQRLLGQAEKTLLADQAEKTLSANQAMARSARDEARRNRADLAAISDEEVDALQLGGGLAPTFTDEDVAALELGGGLVPRTREEIEARSPLIRERLAELSQRTGLPLGTEALQAPGSREALGTGLESRGVIPQAEAELLGETVRPRTEEPVTQRDQRDLKRINQMFNAAGDDSLYSLLEQDGTLPDVLDMPDEQFDEYMFDLMPLGGGLVNRLGD